MNIIIEHNNGTGYFSYAPIEVQEAVKKWAETLDATYMIIHDDKYNFSVSLYCGNDCICNHYNLTLKELYKYF